jgi:plasmid stabilization system protein ParE
MKFRFHPEAEAEFDEAIAFYEEQEIGLGIRFSQAVRAAIDRMLRDPESFPKTGIDDARFIVVKTFPYKIVYVVLQQEIEIHAVAHHRRRSRYWTHRLPGSES